MRPKGYAKVRHFHGEIDSRHEGGRRQPAHLDTWPFLLLLFVNLLLEVGTITVKIKIDNKREVTSRAGDPLKLRAGGSVFER